MNDSEMNDIGNSYDKICEQWYDFRKNTKINRCVAEFSELLRPGSKVLDVGCGTGYPISAYLVGRGFTVTGIDISEKMLEEAQKRNSSSFIEYKCMAIEDFDFQPETYDIVISSLTFHYLESFINICRKVSSCLTKGGSFVFSVEHPIFTW